MKKSNKRVVNVLRKARNLLQEKKWVQNTLAVAEDGSYTGATARAAGLCSVGAILAATSSNTLATTAEIELERNISERSKYTYLSSWNDTKSRRKKHVLDLFDKTIKKLEKDV